jgi:hypothetical protein
MMKQLHDRKSLGTRHDNGMHEYLGREMRRQAQVLMSVDITSRALPVQRRRDDYHQEFPPGPDGLP